MGEPGTGKSVLADYIHRLSGRAGELIKRSLGSHTHELEYDTLAGHVAGSFTGASGERKGLVEAAHLGTLFLDEIALAPPGVQDLLLELLDDGRLRRLGENRSRPVDVRFIFATNADLNAAAREKRFRTDLLDRIGSLRITLPPLRDRRDEILPLARHFIGSHARLFGDYSPSLAPESEQCLLQADWPGNIRGLETAMQYAVLIAHPDQEITPDHLPPEVQSASGVAQRPPAPTGQQISDALTRAGGSKSDAARHLGISRKHLYALIRKERIIPARRAVT
jgi:DNA-binding NtrC family response regulator